MQATFNSTIHPLDACQIEDIKLASSNMSGATRRSFQATMALKYCRGNVRMVEEWFGWGRRTVELGLREQRSGIICFGAQAARSGRPLWEDKHPKAAQTILTLAELYCQQDPTFRTTLSYTRLTAAEAIKQLRAKGFQKDQIPSCSTMSEVLNRNGYRLRKVVKAKPQKKIPETDAIFFNIHKKDGQPIENKSVTEDLISTEECKIMDQLQDALNLISREYSVSTIIRGISFTYSICYDYDENKNDKHNIAVQTLHPIHETHNNKSISCSDEKSTNPIQSAKLESECLQNDDNNYKSASQFTECANKIKIKRLSIDCKATVNIGNYSRGGKTRGNNLADDHDMGCKEKYTPFGVLEEDEGKLHLTFGSSFKTSDFIVDSLENWWESISEQERVSIAHIQIKVDNGPESSGVRTQFLKRMVKFSDHIGKAIQLLYYPPYHSKYNPIERCWGILEQHWNGSKLVNVETMLGFSKSMTWKGIEPMVKLNRKIYRKGISISKKAMREIESRLERNPLLPKWDILIRPT